MTIFYRGTGSAPAWSEVEWFDFIILKSGEQRDFTTTSQKEALFVVKGECRLTTGTFRSMLRHGQHVMFPNREEFGLAAEGLPAILLRVAGHWGDLTGSCGVFTLNNSPSPRNDGDPVDYPRTTEFDNHFHDCDEFWFIVEGSGTAVSGGVTHSLKPGDCLATQMGEHHDFPRVTEPILGVYFETTLHGRKREGHLWEHTHGKAVIPGN